MSSHYPWSCLEELTLELRSLEHLFSQAPVEGLITLKNADYIHCLLNQVMRLRELS